MKVISILTKNRFGALTRISNVFSRRGINIKQLTVAETTNELISRITILTSDFDLTDKQLNNHLKKIEDVQDSIVLPLEGVISKELLLVKIKCEEDKLEDIKLTLSESNGNIVSFDDGVLIGQVVNTTEKTDEFIQNIKGFEIIEMSRSGITALTHH